MREGLRNFLTIKNKKFGKTNYLVSRLAELLVEFPGFSSGDLNPLTTTYV
jgi:hypothetical protein